jgi:hypothetical protein
MLFGLRRETSAKKIQTNTPQGSNTLVLLGNLIFR